MSRYDKDGNVFPGQGYDVPGMFGTTIQRDQYGNQISATNPQDMWGNNQVKDNYGNTLVEYRTDAWGNKVFHPK